MKTPPVIENNSGKEDKKNYLYGDKILFGIPNRTYFELYDGACASNKIFSVQKKNCLKDAVAVIYYPEDNVNVPISDFADREPLGHQHIFVSYSADLSKYLNDMGIQSDVVYYADCENKGLGMKTYKTAAFVNPTAFEWLTQEQIEELIPDEYFSDESQSTKKSSKVIIAAIIAALSLLK